MGEADTLRDRWAALQPCAERPLSEREGRALVALALGLRDKEIAAALGIAVPTVRALLGRIKGKLPSVELAGRGSIAAWAWRHRGCCLRGVWLGLE